MAWGILYPAGRGKGWERKRPPACAEGLVSRGYAAGYLIFFTPSHIFSALGKG